MPRQFLQQPLTFVPGVSVCSAVSNKFFINSRPINREEQTLMAFGGLRGAIAVSLANSLNSKFIRNTPLFVTTTLYVIIFTVFVFGSSTKALVKLLRVKRQSRKDTRSFGVLISKVIEGAMPLVEEIAGQRQANYWMVSCFLFFWQLLILFPYRTKCMSSTTSTFEDF